MRGHLFTLSIDAHEARPFRRNGFDYVALPSGEEYAVNLHNHHDTRCDVELYVDGEHVGGFVIQAHETIRIERPEGKQKKFTFVGETSRIARSVGTVVGSVKNGLVSAIFKPQKHVVYESIRGSAMVRRMSPRESARTSAAPSFGAGVTVLGNKSDQTFQQVRGLKDDEIDWPLSTEVSVRLVVDNERKNSPLHHSYPPRLDY